MGKSLIERYFSENPGDLPDFQAEKSVLEACLLLEEVMRQERVNRTELARRLGKTKGWVTQLLDSDKGKTIRTFSRAFAALGRQMRFSVSSITVHDGDFIAHMPPDSWTWTPGFSPSDSDFHLTGHQLV